MKSGHELRLVAALLAIFSAFLARPVLAATSQDLPLRTTYNTSSEALTTEKIWRLDPGEINPHRQRWVLNRNVEIKDMETREMPGDSGSARYGVNGDSIVSVTTSYFRADGPWYRPMSEFPCTPEPLSWFGTLEGAHQAAAAAAQAWDQLLTSERVKLSLVLERLTASTPGYALKKADTAFKLWLKELDDEWRTRSRGLAKQKEWKFYQDQTKGTEICTKAKQTSIPWELMMEAPGTGEQGLAGTQNETKLLARAPARRWDGLFSIHASVMIAGRKLNGRFLIDSGVGTSVLSPTWLTAQGILPAWVENLRAPLKRVPWGAGSEGGLAPQAIVDRVDVGNFPVAITNFLLFDTEFFAPPESSGSCCDGVLGTDFMRSYVVELQAGPPAEVKLWPAENFHLESNATSKWLETALTADGEPVSTCVAQLGATASPLKLVGVRWDTGREAAFDIHLPWQKAARAAIASGRPNSWEISCGPSTSEPVARGVLASFPVMDAYENSAILDKVPAFSVGMQLLGRERIFLDFPHGRIWVPAKTSSTLIRENRSGLQLKFDFIKGKGDQRGLYVKSIKPQSPSRELIKRGLKTGQMIVRMDSIDADKLDAWEVEQRLSGVYGDKVVLQWKTPKGLRLGELKVR